LNSKVCKDDVSRLHHDLYLYDSVVGSSAFGEESDNGVYDILDEIQEDDVNDGLLLPILFI
jgi:hypothetical protein